MGPVIAIGSMVLFALGLIAIFRPSSIGLRSRLAAAALLTAAFPLLLFAVESDSKPEEGMQGVTIVGLVIWVLIMLILWAVRRALQDREAARKCGKEPARRVETAQSNGDHGPANDAAERAAFIVKDKELRNARAARPAPLADRHTSDPKVKFSAPGRPRAKHGRRVCFTYVDEHGEVTDREVTGWVRTRYHLEGFCTARKAQRTFRIDRVEKWGVWS